MTNPDFHPRRSCLYMPSSNERALEKAKSLPADTIIFDLEDAVAPDSKEEAREKACEAISSGEYGKRELVVRVNSVDTPWHAEDLSQLCERQPDAILVPKIQSGSDIERIVDAMEKETTELRTKLWVMIEMPRAILNLDEIARLGETTRLTCFVMGFNDLAKEMKAEHDRSNFLAVMSQAVIAARAYGLDILDSVYNDFSDPEGLERECEEARRIGFDGKTLIHPSQIDIANRVFAPGENQVAEAQSIVAAFNDPVNAGKGVIVVDGKMTELLHLKQAEQLLAVNAAIEALNA